MGLHRREKTCLLGAATVIAALVAIFLSVESGRTPSPPEAKGVVDRTMADGLAGSDTAEPEDAGHQQIGPSSPSEAREIRFVVKRAEDDQPEENARVTIVHFSPSYRDTNVARSAQCETGADGHAVFAIPEDWNPRGLLASATSEDGLLASPSASRCSAGDLVETALVPACRIEGKVIGLRTGEHQSARVLAWSHDWPESPKRRLVEVRSDGSFSVLGVTSYVKLYALADGRAPSEYWVGKTGGGALRPGEVCRVLLELGSPATPVRIRVLDEDGHPLPFGSQVATSTEDRAWIASWANADGWVDLAGVCDGGPTKVHVWPQRGSSGEGWHTLAAEFQVDSSDDSREFVMRRAAGNTTFRVLDAEGMPLADSPLLLLSESDRGGVQLMSDGNGVVRPFEKHPRPPGQYRLLTNDERQIWRGEVGKDAKVIDVPTKKIPVRVTFADADGIRVRAPHVSVAIVPFGTPQRDSLKLPSPTLAYRSFEKRGEVTLLVDEDRFRSYASVRAHFKGVTVRDYPLNGKRCLEITPPSSTGSVRVTVRGALGSGSIFFVLAEGEFAGLRFHGYIAKNGSGRLLALPPGRYDWHTEGLPVRRSGSGHTIATGAETLLTVK